MIIQSFAQAQANKEFFAQKIAKIVVCLAKVTGGFAECSGKVHLLQSGIYKSPGSLYSSFTTFFVSRMSRRFEDGLHVGSRELHLAAGRRHILLRLKRELSRHAAVPGAEIV